MFRTESGMIVIVLHSVWQSRQHKMAFVVERCCNDKNADLRATMQQAGIEIGITWDCMTTVIKLFFSKVSEAPLKNLHAEADFRLACQNGKQPQQGSIHPTKFQIKGVEGTRLTS